MDSHQIKTFISSLSTSNEKSNEYILKKVAKMFFDDKSENYQTQFIIGQINSKDIEKLLTLLENKDKRIRKLTLLLLSFLLKNGKSKIYFLEKCGLGLKLGKIFLSRLKYLTLNIKDLGEAIKVLTTVIEEGRANVDKQSLFWYVPLVDREKRTILTKNIQFCHFSLKNIEIDDVDEICPDNIPDPIYNLCGIDLTVFDLQDGSLMENSIDISKVLNNSLLTHESNIVNSRIEQGTPKNSTKKSRRRSVIKEDDNRSQRSVTNTSQYSALNRSHISPFKEKNKMKNKKLKAGAKPKVKSRLRRE